MSDPVLALVWPLGGNLQAPVDPGFGQGHPAPPHASTGPVPPGMPVDPAWGAGHPLPPHVGGGPARPPGHASGMPLPPDVGLWPPPPGIDNSLPPGPPGHVDNSLPVQPIDPGKPDAPPPGSIWPPIHGVEGDALILVYVPYVGFRWVVIDTDLTPDTGLDEPQPK